MHEYRIFETEQFRKDLNSIIRAGRKAIIVRLRRSVYWHLREYPHFGPHVRKLKGCAQEAWRYRIGSWRFVYEYEVDEEERVASMIGASHRGPAYRFPDVYAALHSSSGKGSRQGCPLEEGIDGIFRNCSPWGH